jgi:CBS domain containing-hemolysin-like protein
VTTVWGDWIMFGCGLILIVGTGFFVATEFALVTLDRPEVEAMRDQGVRGLNLTIRALKNTWTHVSAAQLGITLTTLLTGFLMEPAISSLVSPVFEGWGMSAGAAHAVSSILAIVIATFLSMIIGELIPKAFALTAPLGTARVVIPFQTAFAFVFKPVVWLFSKASQAVVRGLGIEPKEELSGARSSDELASLVERSAEAGVLERDTATLLSRTLAFSELTAVDVMTPRLQMAAIEKGESAVAVLELAKRTGFSRFPVIDDGLDDVVGVVHVKYALAVPRDRRKDVPVSAIMTEPLRVPETLELDALMIELRGRGYQLAIVVDEYGGTAGMTTLEDLVEELVGEVSDEHDRTRAGVTKRAGTISFPGNLRPDELEDQTGIVIPEDGPFETVAGFVMGMLGQVPKVDDEVSDDQGTYRVIAMDGRRIDRIRFIPHPRKAGENDG